MSRGLPQAAVGLRAGRGAGAVGRVWAGGSEGFGGAPGVQRDRAVRGFRDAPRALRDKGVRGVPGCSAAGQAGVCPRSVPRAGGSRWDGTVQRAGCERV